MRHLFLACGNIFAFSSIFIIALLIPYISNLKKVGLTSLIIYFVYLLIGVVSLLFLIPSVTDVSNTLSIYILARRVNFGSFIQRIDAVFLLIWIMSIFSYLAIVMHFALSSCKKAINTKHQNYIIYIFAIALFVISMLPQNISDLSFFENTVYKYASIIFVFIICFAILIVRIF